MNTVTLPWPPSECSPNARCHWSIRAKAAKQYRETCFYLAKEVKLKAPAEGKIHLWLNFYRPTRVRIDDDNLIARAKSGRDGLADALQIDDTRFVTHAMLCDEIVKGGEVRVTLTSGLMP